MLDENAKQRYNGPCMTQRGPWIRFGE